MIILLYSIVPQSILSLVKRIAGVWVSKRLTGLWSTKRVCFPPPFTVSGQKSFDTSHEFRCGQLEDLGEFENCGEGRTKFSAFQQAYVLRVIPTLESKRFLCEVTLLPDLTEDLRKRSFLWRSLLLSGRHPQLGVCGVSVNTSTKYSIPPGVHRGGFT